MYPKQIQIVVGNVGTVFDGTDKDRAKDVYLKYVALSMAPGNRCTLESVVWFQGGDIVREFDPEYLSGQELANAHGVSDTCDFSLPLGWFKEACKIAGENVSGHIVWNYPEGNIGGEPFGLTELGRETIETMEAS